MMLRRIALAATTHASAGALCYYVGYRTGVHDASDATRQFERQIKNEQASKQELLEHLQHGAFVKLGQSDIAGVGVFALIDIPAGVNPFVAPNAHLRSERNVLLTADELQACPPAVVRHVLDFHDHVLDNEFTDAIEYPEKVKVNAGSTVSMDASWYLNHSEAAPNVEHDTTRNTDSDGFWPYRTTRLVRAGEELLLDYRVALPGVYAQMQAQRRRDLGVKVVPPWRKVAR